MYIDGIEVRDTGDWDGHADGTRSHYYELGGRPECVIVARTPESAVRLARRLGWF